MEGEEGQEGRADFVTLSSIGLPLSDAANI